MKDIHSHLLYGIDDGCINISESIKLLKQMELKGVTELVLTPHYIANSNYVCDVLNKNKIFRELQNEVNKQNINIKLYLGNEIYLDEDIIDLLKNNKISSINNSKYLLIEFPMINYPIKAKSIFSELIYNGYIIILAHPERYMYVSKDIKILDDFKEMGVLFQGNYESLFGKYGTSSKKTLKKLLKNKYISFLAGDIHHNVDLDLKKLEKELKKYLTSNEINDILNINFEKVIRNEDVREVVYE